MDGDNCTYCAIEARDCAALADVPEVYFGNIGATLCWPCQWRLKEALDGRR
jgi:hypothetical protein